MTARTFRLTSLGCAKNLVDSEGVAGQLVRAGWQLVADGPADLVIVNTCGFVEEAAQESVDTLLAEIEEKRAGRTRWLAAVGCLPQKYQRELARSLPAIDLVAGVSDMFRLAELVAALLKRRRVTAISPPAARYEESEVRLVSTPRHRAYLKVAEGCSNACAYCIIGRLRGPFRSRAPQAVVREARTLAAQGAVELSLVAQDLTRYGRDLQPATSLPALLRRLDRIRDLRWIRLLYAHPARVDDRLARTMAACRRVVPYLDVPLQHVSDRVLARMGRPQTRAQSEAVIARLRREAPHIALRTTFLVGHPGETDADFAALLEFVTQHRFEHLGAFAWSPEEGTPSYTQTPWVPEEVRQERLARLLARQQKISRRLWREWIGRGVEVLIEEVLHQHSAKAYTHVGRIAQQAPEVDGVTYVRAPRETSCRVGEIVRARVIRTADYDLFTQLV